jgi:hypothetical protein
MEIGSREGRRMLCNQKYTKLFLFSLSLNVDNSILKRGKGNSVGNVFDIGPSEERKWVLRRIFGPKRDEVTGGWRKLHNEELHNL